MISLSKQLLLSFYFKYKDRNSSAKTTERKNKNKYSVNTIQNKLIQCKNEYFNHINNVKPLSSFVKTRATVGSSESFSLLGLLVLVHDDCSSAVLQAVFISSHETDHRQLRFNEE